MPDRRAQRRAAVSAQTALTVGPHDYTLEGASDPNTAGVLGTIGDRLTWDSSSATYQLWLKTTGTTAAVANGWVGVHTTATIASGAPTNGKFVTWASDATLSNNRVATGTAGRITITDTTVNDDGALTWDLATTAVTPGAYTNVNATFDAYGRATAAESATAYGCMYETYDWSTQLGSVTWTDVTSYDGVNLTDVSVTSSTANGTIASGRTTKYRCTYSGQWSVNNPNAQATAQTALWRLAIYDTLNSSYSEVLGTVRVADATAAGVTIYPMINMIALVSITSADKLVLQIADHNPNADTALSFFHYEGNLAMSALE